MKDALQRKRKEEKINSGNKSYLIEKMKKINKLSEKYYNLLLTFFY